MSKSKARHPLWLTVGLLAAVLLPGVAAAQVEEARVRIDGMV